MSKHLAVAVVLCLSVCLAGPARADMRGVPYSPEQLFKQSTLVFEGTVTEIETVEKYDNTFPISAKVVTVLKGKADQKALSFKHKDPGDSVIYEQEFNKPEVGEMGTFYLQDQAGTLVLIGYIRTVSSVGSRGLLFTVSLPKARFARAEAIPLRLIVKNAAAEAQRVPSLRPNVHDKPPSIRSGMYLICQQGERILPFKGGYFKRSEPGIELKPGAAHPAFELDLRLCFDLGPGSYDVQILFTTRYSGFVDAASNRLTFTIEEK